jgi:hypothetical protein
MPHIIGALITNKICGYLDFMNISYNNCVQLFDIILTNNYNNMIIHENNQEES